MLMSTPEYVQAHISNLTSSTADGLIAGGINRTTDSGVVQLTDSNPTSR